MEDEKSKVKQQRVIAPTTLSRRDEAVIKFVSEWFFTHENQTQGGDEESKSELPSETAPNDFTQAQELVEIQQHSNDKNEALNLDKLQSTKR